MPSLTCGIPASLPAASKARNAMTKALMTDFDQQMGIEIGAHFGGYFQ